MVQHLPRTVSISSSSCSSARADSALNGDVELPVLFVHEYSAESPLRRPRRFLREAVQDLRSAVDPAIRLFRVHLAQRYRHSSLGLLWAFAPSLLIAVAVSLGQRARLPVLAASTVPAQFYAIFGLVLFQTFLESFNIQRSLFGNCQLFRTHRTALESSILCGLLDACFSLLVKLPMLICVFAFYAVAPSTTFPLSLLGLLLVVGIGSGMGLLFAPWNAVRRDLEHVMNFLPWLLFAVTPIFSAPSAQSALGWAYRINPLTAMFGTMRSLAYGSCTKVDALVFCVMLFLTLAVFPFGWLLCRIARSHVIECVLQ